MNERTERQSFLGPQSEEVFKTAKVGVIGLCGGGSHVAQQLAHIGFENILICDADHVESTNLNRMVGSTPGDATQKERKTLVIERMIKTVNPEATVTKIDNLWQMNQMSFRDCIAIIGCVDSFAARDELERFCRRFLISYIDVGMDVHDIDGGYAISGQIILSLPNAPCMRCLGFLSDVRLADEQKRYGAAGGRPQVIWPNGVLSSIAVGQLVGLLSPWNSSLQPSIMLEYDGNRQTVRESTKLSLLAQCVCPHFKIEGSLGDPLYATQNSQKLAQDQLKVC